MKWELIEDVLDAGEMVSDRLRVPQGWLVRTILRGGLGQQISCSQLLIQDSDHTWVLEEPDSRWKEIDESRPDDFIVSEYLLVPGGWVVRTLTSVTDEDERDGRGDVQQTFISDPDHTWIKQQS